MFSFGWGVYYSRAKKPFCQTSEFLQTDLNIGVPQFYFFWGGGASVRWICQLRDYRDPSSTPAYSCILKQFKNVWTNKEVS